MAIIALPVATRFLRKIEWTLDRPAQVNRSAYTGRRQVVANPWHGKWSASCELLPIVGETAMLAWRAFFVGLKGQINTVRLPATEGGQASLPPAITHGNTLAGATSLLVKTASSGASIPGLLAGHLITVQDQLCCVLAASPDIPTGATLAVIEPPLRAAIAHDTTIEIVNPTCLVALVDSSVNWSVEPGKIYGVAMKVEEAF